MTPTTSTPCGETSPTTGAAISWLRTTQRATEVPVDRFPPSPPFPMEGGAPSPLGLRGWVKRRVNGAFDAEAATLAVVRRGQDDSEGAEAGEEEDPASDSGETSYGTGTRRWRLRAADRTACDLHRRREHEQ